MTFRGDENAALLRAARLEEENERLRKELEEAKHPKPPPEPPRKAEASGDSKSTFRIAMIITAPIVAGILI